MSNQYRINVRFNLDDEDERKIADYLKSLYIQEKKSRNRFIVDAISFYMKKEQDCTLQNIKSVFRELLQEYGTVPLSDTKATVIDTELSEEEQIKNEASVLQDLEIFG